MAATGRAGYEYNYQLSVKDEIVPRYKYHLVESKKTFIYEVTTIFAMKKTGGEDEMLGSERYMAQVCLDVIKEGHLLPNSFNALGSDRLKDYWMTEEDIDRLGHEVDNLAKQTAEADHRGVVPIGIDLQVCTVQQENEQVGSTLERAIRPEKLVPLYLLPFHCFPKNEPLPPPIPFSDTLLIFLKFLERIRVEDVGEGLAMMRDCGVCSLAPIVGDQISVLPACGHAFHSHCIVGSLLEDKRECPLCHSSVNYDF